MSSIGYHNLLRETGATVTASSEATGYPKENAYDWLPYDSWQPTAAGSAYIDVDLGSAKSADYFGLHGHNLADVTGSVKLQYSTDGITYNDAFTAISPTTNATIYKEFTTLSYRYWRVLFSTTGTAANAAVISFGDRLETPYGMPVGFTPPGFGGDNEYLDSISDGGIFLGRSLIRKGQTCTIEIDMIDPAWMRSNWATFVTHFQKLPFFFAWDYTNYSSEVALCWLDGDPTPPSYTSPTFMGASLPVRMVQE